jgi:hypothetical protein
MEFVIKTATAEDFKTLCSAPPHAGTKDAGVNSAALAEHHAWRTDQSRIANLIQKKVLDALTESEKAKTNYKEPIRKQYATPQALSTRITALKKQ